MCYSDTDSFVYLIQDHDVYDFIKNNIDEFDTSDYIPDNPFNMPRVNKEVLGKMKDECSGAIMTHFIGLHSKMYCTKVEGQVTSTKIKFDKNARKNPLRLKVVFSRVETISTLTEIVSAAFLKISLKNKFFRIKKKENGSKNPHGFFDKF